MDFVKPEEIPGWQSRDADEVEAALRQAHADADEIFGELSPSSAFVVNTPQASGITLDTKAFAVTKVTRRIPGEEDEEDEIEILDPEDYELTAERFTVRLTTPGARFGVMGEVEYLTLADVIERKVYIRRLAAAILTAGDKGEELSAEARADILRGA